MDGMSLFATVAISVILALIGVVWGLSWWRINAGLRSISSKFCDRFNEVGAGLKRVDDAFAKVETRFVKVETLIEAWSARTVSRELCTATNTATWQHIADVMAPLATQVGKLANGTLSELSERIRRLEAERVSAIEAQVERLQVQLDERTKGARE